MIVTAIFEAKAGKADELRKQLHNGASASWQESGVKSYAVHELINNYIMVLALPGRSLV